MTDDRGKLVPPDPETDTGLVQDDRPDQPVIDPEPPEDEE